jgi:hypothetical protein
MTAVMKRVAKRRNIAAMLERILGLAIKKTCETHGWRCVWLEGSYLRTCVEDRAFGLKVHI